MKFALLLTFLSCATKTDFHQVIDKRNFSLDKKDSVITKKLTPGKKESATQCYSQIFFSGNAQKDNYRQISRLLSRICPESNYLMDVDFEETWWTTIAYSRSCISVEAICPRVKPQD